MYKKRILILALIISILATIFINYTTIAAEQIQINMTKENDGNITLKVNSEKKIKDIRVYLKRETEKYQLFYKSSAVNSNTKTYKITRTRLSTEKETYFKVIVIDEEGTESAEEFKTGTIQETPSASPSPSQTPTPSASQTPAPSTTPSPSNSQTPAPSNKPSPSPSASQAPAEVTNITLNYSDISLNVGGTKTLKATITPKTVNTKITWSTSNSKIATVTAQGKITAKSPGTATIKVKTSNGKQATCKVTVKLSVSSQTKPKSKSGNGYSQVITLGGRTFKLYKQYSGSYGQKPYNSTSQNTSVQRISNTGCGPSSIAIVLSGYGSNKNPYGVGSKLLNNKIPSSLTSMKKELQAMGMKAETHSNKDSYTKTYNEIKKALESGHQVVIFVGKNANSKYWKSLTNTGYHYVSILGIDTSNNKVYIGNPGKSGGWYNLSQIAHARGTRVGSMAGWIEIYK